MTAEFEKEKNRKAGAITLGITAALVFLFFLVKWPLPTLEQPQFQELMEVNLGSGDEGFGTDQPLLPGEPAPAQQMSYTPPQPVKAQTSDAKDFDTDDRPDNDAPALTRPPVTKPNATKIDENNKTVKTNNTTSPQPVVQAPPRPRAVLGRTVGGNGNGGNGADSYSRGGNEGVAGGTGDQGQPGGDPNSSNYNGPRKNFGVQVFNLPSQSFEDDFNENAKVAMDVVVDAAGKVLSATYQARGSTTSKRELIEIARRRAFQLKFNSSENGQKGTAVFNFVVKG